MAVEDRLAGVDAGVMAARFHNSIVEMLADTCDRLRERTGIGLVALSGGVFQNALIHARLGNRLRNLGFEVLVHRLLPPNDACISLGQVAVAAAVSQSRRK
jgi:hydrogenase maturation protein HypF